MKKASILTSLFMGGVLAFQPIIACADDSNLSLSQKTQSNAAAFGLPDFTTLVEQNNQVVVNISTTKEVAPQNHPQFRGLSDEMLRYFFGIPGSKLDEFKDRFNESPSDTEKKRSQPHSLGSGFIISADGYILTNHHVVNGSDEIIVTLSDRKELKAELIGSDERTDVALLKIEESGLPFAKIGTRKDLKVGQWVLAIGAPFGLDYTVTHGIISALGRALPDDTYVPFIQTDVAINPGNSGGPLFNLAGDVVGINSQIYSSSGGAMGLSFSIPIDIAMDVVNQLKAKGEVVRGYLGVLVQEVTSDLSKSFGLDKPMGALVGETYPDTPAEKAGVQAGDIILEFDGKTIHKSADLPPIVGITPINKAVKMKVLRQGKTEIVKVTLAALESDKKAVEVKINSSESNQLGAQVENLDEAVLRELKLPFGVGVTAVTGGPAEQAGLRRGDVLVTINYKPVKSVKDLDKLLDALPKNRSLPVRVIRGGRSLFLPLTLEK